jgi:hypothetical protein
LKRLAFVIILFLLPLSARADDAVPAEIDYLLRSVGDSGCTFFRNGERYDSPSAEAHLRMKYQRGKRHAPTSEKFIERLASSSYLSKKLYYVECEGKKMPSGDWLTERLVKYRAGNPNDRP